MTIIYEKNSDNVLFKKLVDDSYHVANPNGGEYLAWKIINGDAPVNPELDSIVI